MDLQVDRLVLHQENGDIRNMPSLANDVEASFVETVEITFENWPGFENTIRKEKVRERARDRSVSIGFPIYDFIKLLRKLFIND